MGERGGASGDRVRVRVTGGVDKEGVVGGGLGLWPSGPACWAEAQWGPFSLSPFFCLFLFFCSFFCFIYFLVL